MLGVGRWAGGYFQFKEGEPLEVVWEAWTTLSFRASVQSRAFGSRVRS